MTFLSVKSFMFIIKTVLCLGYMTCIDILCHQEIRQGNNLMQADGTLWIELKIVEHSLIMKILKECVNQL